MVKVLLVEDKENIIRTYRNLLTPETNKAAPAEASFSARVKTPKEKVSAKVEMLVATNLQDAQLMFTTFQPDLVITDQQYPSFPGGPVEENGLKMVKFVKGGMRKDTTVAWNSAILLPFDLVLAQGADYAFDKADTATKVPEILDKTLQKLNGIA